MRLSWLSSDDQHSSFLVKSPSIISFLHPMILPSPEPRPHSLNKVSPCLSISILSPTKNWLAARIRKHLQTAWDLVSQTRLWHSEDFAIGYKMTLSTVRSESSHGESINSSDQQKEHSTPQGELGSNFMEPISYEVTDHDEATTLNWRDCRPSVTQTGGIALAIVKKFEWDRSMLNVQASSRVCPLPYLQSRPLLLLASSHPHPPARECHVPHVTLRMAPIEQRTNLRNTMIRLTMRRVTKLLRKIDHASGR